MLKTSKKMFPCVNGFFSKPSLSPYADHTGKPLVFSHTGHVNKQPVSLAYTTTCFYSEVREKEAIYFVKLKNGKIYTENLVKRIYKALENLQNDNSIAFHALVLKCRNPNYKIDYNSQKIISRFLTFGPYNDILDVIKDVVLSSVEGDGNKLDWELTDPISHTIPYKI